MVATTKETRLTKARASLGSARSPTGAAHTCSSVGSRQKGRTCFFFFFFRLFAQCVELKSDFRQHMRPRWKDGPEFLFRFNGWHRAAWRRSRVPGSAVVQWIWLGQQGDFTRHFAWSFDPPETRLALHTYDREAARQCILLLSSLWFARLDWLYLFLVATSQRTLNDNMRIRWNVLLKNEPNLFIFLQFPGGSDNYLTISGSSHPFLSSSEVGLYIFTLHGNLFSERTLFMATKPNLAAVTNALLGYLLK